MGSREGGTLQTGKHCKGTGQRAKMCSIFSAAAEKMGGGLADTKDLLCWLPFCVNLSFFPTINLCSSACHLLYYLSLYTAFPYNVLSPAAFYFQLTHSDLDLPSHVKALHGNSIPPAAFTPLFWVLCVTPLSLVLLLQGIRIFLGQGLLGAMFTQSLVQLRPCAG